MNTSFTTDNEYGSCENKQLKLKDLRGKLWTCEKQLKSIEFRKKKKDIPTIFLGVGAKKFTNNSSLLFKMSIRGKPKKAPTENNKIAPGTSLESG